MVKNGVVLSGATPQSIHTILPDLSSVLVGSCLRVPTRDACKHSTITSACAHTTTQEINQQVEYTRTSGVADHRKLLMTVASNMELAMCRVERSVDHYNMAVCKAAIILR